MVKHFNRSGQLRYYPGSPLIARQLLREQDSPQLTELTRAITRCCVLNFRKTAVRASKKPTVSSSLKAAAAGFPPWFNPYRPAV